MAAAGAIALAAVAISSGGGGEPPPEPPPGAVDLRPCRSIIAADRARDCIARQFARVVAGRRDPRPAVERIAAAARQQGGFVLTNCHVVMHAVGREYASAAGVKIATLMDNLPRTNDPGCSAGFAHGLVTAVAPQFDVTKPEEATAVCSRAGTRYQRYSCVHGFGHAFMRLYGDDLEPSLKLCRALGESAPDCAQGAYHDYWFAVLGADEATLPAGAATDPRALCGAQPEEFVRGCWYRALLETRPEGLEVTTAGDLDAICAGLGGLQREACITGAAVIGPPDPAEQLAICARLRSASDAAGCVRGTKVANLLDRPAAEHVRLIRRCGRFAAAATRSACYRWLGKTLAVLTDGEFERTGCSRLAPAARRDCVAGARTMEAALVTFS